ncbi:MAG: hypothetical protein GY822_18320 [Deltaproteobacteria bacterium]|nr:hypothetical protein [Deltaproteobacteria bacterium]
MNRKSRNSMRSIRSTPTSSSQKLKRTCFVGLVFLAATFLGVACAEEVPPPQGVQKNISVEFTSKESCQPVVNYDLECLSAVLMRLVPEAGGDVVERCVKLSPEDRPANLFNFLSGNDVLRFMRASSGRWILQVRGIHDRSAEGGFDPCAAGADVERWLFWGETPDAIDFGAFEKSDAGVMGINLRVECRDCTQGCTTLGDVTCPARMPPAFCVPSDSQLTCGRTCQDDQSCFEGALECIFGDATNENGRCYPEGGDPQSSARTFCTPCTNASDCSDGYFCVGSDDNRFCARDCPASFCPRGATCNRLGDGLLQY